MPHLEEPPTEDGAGFHPGPASSFRKVGLLRQLELTTQNLAGAGR